MYEIHPAEWGPSRHQPEHPQSHAALQAVLDLRDVHAPRPDDN